MTTETVKKTYKIEDIKLEAKQYYRRGYIKIDTRSNDAPKISSFVQLISVYFAGDRELTVIVEYDGDSVFIKRQEDENVIRHKMSTAAEAEELIAMVKQLAIDTSNDILNEELSYHASHALVRIIEGFDETTYVTAIKLLIAAMPLVTEVYDFMQSDESLRSFYDSDVEEMVDSGKIDLENVREFIRVKAGELGLELYDLDDDDVLLKVIRDVLCAIRDCEDDYSLRSRYNSYFYSLTYEERREAYRKKVIKETAERRQTAKLLGLTALKGTLKQKKWAEDIRRKFLENASADEDVYLFLKSASCAQHSKFWIETRDISTAVKEQAIKTLIVATRKANEIGEGNEGYDEQVKIRQAAIDKLGVEI